MTKAYKKNALLTSEQSELVENNHNLIYGCAKHYNIDINEHYGLLALGLCKAAQDYDCTKSAFNTYAYYRMYQEYRNMIKGLYYDKRKISQMTSSLDSENRKTKIDPGEEDMNLSNIENNLLLRSKEVLTPKQFQVAKLYATGLSSKDIADILHCSKQCVHQYKKSIKRHITRLQEGGI